MKKKIQSLKVIWFSFVTSLMLLLVSGPVEASSLTTTQNLPNTGEEYAAWALVLGGIIVVVVLVIIFFRRRNKGKQ